MLQRIIHKIALRRHFWRHATFSEIGELYAARVLRLFASHMVALFVPVYLYNSGFSLLFIATYFALYYGAKAVIVSPIAAYLASRIGPKHSIMCANFLYIPAVIVLAYVPQFGLEALIVFSMFQGLSATIYDFSHLVDFSKIKHTQHAGKELGFMQVFEKIATTLSPLIGGGIAALFGPAAAMWAAAVVFAIAALPLLMSPEPIRTHQKIKWAGFPWKRVWRNMTAEAAIGFDIATLIVAWQLFIATVVLANAEDSVYASLGLFASLGMLGSVVAANIYGKVIDKKAGEYLLRYSVIGKMLTYVARPFVATPAGVVGVNTGSEVATTGYAMAFMRGMFDAADKSGHRLAYMYLIEAMLNAGAALACASLAILLFILESPAAAMQSHFIVAAVVVLFVATPKFPLYRK